MQKYVGQLHYGIWYFEVRTGTKFSLYDCWTSTRFQYRTNGKYNSTEVRRNEVPYGSAHRRADNRYYVQY